MTHHVLAIAGSLRRDSYNRRLLDAARTLAPPSLRIAIDDGLAALPLFDEDLERATVTGPEPVRRLRAAVAAADGLLIATPEYNNWSMPGVLKNALDWLSRPGPDEVLLGKPIAIVGVSSGRWGTRLAQNNLRQVLASTESAVMPSPSLFVREAAQIFDASGRLVDDPTRSALVTLLARFSLWIDANHPLSRMELPA